MPTTLALGPGLRSTTGRRRIIEILEQQARPLSIPEILTLDPTLAQSSVYRNLTILDRAGVVHTIHPTSHAGHARFELARADGSIPVHSICNACGHVEPVVVSATAIAFTGDDGRPLQLGTITSITVTNTCNRNCPQGADQ